MPKSYIDGDGKWVHTFRQSWIETANSCPEQARQIGQDLIAEGTTDAAAIGTAVHAGINSKLTVDQVEPWEVAHSVFTDLMEGSEGPFTWHMTKEYGARRCIDSSLDLWLDEVYPTLQGPWVSEVGFGPDLFYEDDQRVIYLQGTMDYLGDDGLKDWKTSSRPWTAWEKGRWAVQPTVYTWATDQLARKESKYSEAEGPVVYPFEFVILVHEDDPAIVHLQRITVLRRPSDWQWLQHRCLAWAELIESRIAPWPMQDNGWHCSPKWCPAWDNCKGKFVHDEWPEGTRLK